MIGGAPGAAQETRAQQLLDRLVDRIVDGEQDLIERMSGYQPFMETYIQAMPEETPAGQPTDDHYLLGKVHIGDEGVEWESFAESWGFSQPGRFLFLKFGQKGFRPQGFAQMIVPDAFEFDRETYEFDYLRREFLGEVRALVFDVRPKFNEVGRFIGRIWVEDESYRIVRFNGAYTPGETGAIFFHFDSWRVNAGGDFWVPAYVYIQDEDYTGKVGARFKAQTRLWNYNTVQNNRLDELTAILIDAEKGIRDQSVDDQTTPLESVRMWKHQAQENVIERLERAGLIAPKGEVDDILNGVVYNLLVSNEIDLEIECRVLMTTPLESFSIGQAIVISRGLIDVLPDEASLASVIADELAHIVLGHRMETMYAFSDYTIFDDIDVLDRLWLSREPEEIEAAGERAVELLLNSPYNDSLDVAGLFLRDLTSRTEMLGNLIEANFGNALATQQQLLRLADVESRAPEVDYDNVEQISALPLGSRVRMDAWTNEISLIPPKPLPLRSAKEKLAFEVTPFMIRLTRRDGPEAVDPGMTSRVIAP